MSAFAESDFVDVSGNDSEYADDYQPGTINATKSVYSSTPQQSNPPQKQVYSSTPQKPNSSVYASSAKPSVYASGAMQSKYGSSEIDSTYYYQDQINRNRQSAKSKTTTGIVLLAVGATCFLVGYNMTTQDDFFDQFFGFMIAASGVGMTTSSLIPFGISAHRSNKANEYQQKLDAYRQRMAVGVSYTKTF